MSETRIIKRYANRKLYDTQHSRYVTLDQISEMIRDGDDVKIVDNKTKEDLTSVTLAQIIFEEEKKQRSFLSLQTMRDLIQNGGESFFASLVTEAQRRVTSMLPRRKDDMARDDTAETAAEPDAHAAPADPASAGEPASDAHDTAKRGRDGLGSLREFREWVQQTQHTIDEWQRRVDHRIRDMVGGISPFSGIQKDVNGLASRIAELDKGLASRIAELEAKLAALAHDDSSRESGPSAQPDAQPSAQPDAQPSTQPDAQPNPAGVETAAPSGDESA